TNGLGGYASGTVVGVPTRSYHGLLIAALPAPVGRVLLLGLVSELLRFPDGRTARLGGPGFNGRIDLEGNAHLAEFALDAGLPVWRYEIDDVHLEKRLWMPHGLNAVFLRYRLLKGPDAVRLKLMPAVHFRPYDSPVSTPLPGPFRLLITDGRVELSAENAA